MKDLIKKNRLIKSISKIVKAIIREDIKIVQWRTWDYKIVDNEKTLEIDWYWLLTNRWKYTVSKIFWTIWHNLFTVIPKDFVLQLKPDRSAHAYALSSLEELRVSNKMMYYYPWTRDLFFYSAKLDNKKISSEEASNLKRHKKLLYNIRQDFYNLPYMESDVEIYKVFKLYKKVSKKLLWSDSLEDMMNIFQWELLESYLSLYEEEEDNTKDSNDESLEDTVDTLKQKSEIENKEEQEEISKEISDIIGEEEDKELWLLTSYKDLYDEISHLVPKFTRKLNSILKDNNYNRIWGAFKSWKLNTRKLYKVTTNDNKLFTRKINRNHKDYSIWLLIDCSWSMRWGKDVLAVKSAILMAEVLDRVWIPFEIVWFNLDYSVYKNINQKFERGAKNKLACSFRTNMWTAWNNDGFAIRKINHTIITNSKENTERIIIVLSDWMPAPNWILEPKDSKLFRAKEYDEFDLEKEVVKASKYSKIIWIWIQDDAVKKFYKDNIIINDIELLPEVLLNKLKHNIKRW